MQLVVNIDVDDLERAVAFYRDGLGLRLGRRLFDGSVAEMLGAPVPIQLLQKPAGSPASPRAPQPRDYRRHWTPVHLDFEVADVDESASRALAAGAVLEGEIETFAWGRIACMSDPFGHGFCLVQFLGKGYDEAAA